MTHLDHLADEYVERHFHYADTRQACAQGYKAGYLSAQTRINEIEETIERLEVALSVAREHIERHCINKCIYTRSKPRAGCGCKCEACSTAEVRAKIESIMNGENK